LGRRARAGVGLLAAAALACTGTYLDSSRTRAPGARVAAPELEPEPVPLTKFTVQPEGLTVEENWILDLYTLFHSRDYRNFRIVFPGHANEQAIAHLLIPSGPGPHPVVVVFPILAGSHVVSEGMAKALVNRGYAVAHLERENFDFDATSEIEPVGGRLRAAIRDARRLMDFLVTHPELDERRFAAAGVSMGGMLASVLMGVDTRIRAGFFVMAGGDLARIMAVTKEKPIRAFRRRLIEERGLGGPDEFAELMRPVLDPVDPLRFAGSLDPRDVMLVQARWDQVVPADQTRALWEALGRPDVRRVPSGHYQLLPFFWWAVGKGADHLDRVFAR
jgi:hypothetical protein